MATIPEARFSTNFLDEDFTTDTAPPAGSNGGDGGTQQASSVPSPKSTNPFSTEDTEGNESPEAFSDHFDASLELNQNEPGFNFGANLETRDSVSSLEKVGNEEAGGDHEAGGEEQSLVPGTDTQWEKFENGVSKQNGSATEVVKESAGEKEKSPTESSSSGKKQWENFEDSAAAKSRSLRSAAKSPDRTGAVCAADAMVSESSQWTALGDSHGFTDVDLEEDSNLPFRKTQSMRATTNRRIQIVDSLKQRRLSNTSLDREPYKGSQFKDEDELTRRFKVEKEYQVFVKMDKRVPGTKSKWLPVNIAVKEGVLVIKRSAPPTMPLSSDTVVHPEAPPLHEIKLFHNHTLTSPETRTFDKKSKIHQIKLRLTHIVERRTLRRWLFVEHVSKVKTVVKLGCPDQSVVRSLSDQIGEAIRQLPVTREQGVAYRMNEVFVDVKDYSDILMNCDGAVLERRSLNRIYIQAFLSNLPECRLILNDIEAILLQSKGNLTNSMSRQVRLHEVVLHPCVDKALYKKSREIKFRPVDGYPFELLRCSIDPYVSPPVNVTALMEYSERHHSVRITSSFSVRKKHNLKLRPIKDLMIHFPIPASWSSLFLAESVFGGTKSVRSTAALRGSFRRKIKSNACQITTQLGSAKYEPEHGSIIWNIGNYIETSAPHTFRCDITLKDGMHKPDVMSEYAEVSFTLSGSSTGLQIRAFKVDNCTPERWVKYEILYHYRVQMFPDLSID